MTVENILKSLQVGDVVKMTRTVKVVNATGLYVDFADVKEEAVSGHLFVHRDHGTVEIEMVKKKPRKVKAGDVLSADEFRSRTWKPGTLVRHPDTDLGSFVYVGSGEWLDVDNPDYGFKVDDFTSPEGYKLVYVA